MVGKKLTDLFQGLRSLSSGLVWKFGEEEDGEGVQGHVFPGGFESALCGSMVI